MGINRLDNETHVYTEKSLLQRNDPEKFVNLEIDPPKGVLCYGPPGTGKTLLARAVANRTDVCFIHVIGNAIEGARFDDGVGGDNEVQCTILEIVNQLDGFDL
ncbi:26S proteasome regulatory subunit 7 [Camellia lanceoleosa]|uniref:26S proteasome regulatory subunit 7 n=1 Tax=Camellia lanceoleosa TaxID=1840588 RepID=A0ACC0FUG9_9ERIC|nr:26S proteasome regulatory subunit 7 [Camellia lanceoleosa]